MATISEALAIALEHQQAGHLEMAEEIYRRILAVEPNQADALHLLGVAAHQAGRHEVAIEHIQRAISLKDDEAAFHNNLGEAYTALGRVPEAIACYRRVLDLRPDHVQASHRLGVVFQSLGKLDEARAHFERARELGLDSAESRYNLGVAFQSEGRLDDAIACYRRALEIKPLFAEALGNLGNAYKEQDKMDEAIVCYRRALELKPDFAEVHSNLGSAFKLQGKLDDAVACYRRALELKPDLAGTHRNLGHTLHLLGKLEEALGCYNRAQVLHLDSAESHYNLGVALQDQGRPREAIASYRRALEIDPDHAEAYNNLGVVFQGQGSLDDAAACYRQALRLKPDSAEAHNNLGITLKDQGRLDGAIACYHRALELKPDYFEAYNNLGSALKDQEKLDEAIACYHRALEINSDYVEAHNNLGIAFKDQGKLDDAIACYRRALQHKPDSVEAHNNLLRALQYRDGVTLAELIEANREFEQRHAAPLHSVGQAHDNVRDPNRALRLGFLSPDFGRHPVGYFLRPVLENLDRQQAAAICYHDRIRSDDITAHVQAAASAWRHVYGLTDEQLAEQVRADQIDILFDLAGHTARNRLLVFARKPAPIQITWMGDAGTTGLAAMDYILADRQEIPPDAEQYYCERVLRLPDGYVCYAPPDDAPPVGPLPALAAGHVTFVSFGNPGKITAHGIDRWADVLRRVPRSRLLLKYRGLGDAQTQRRYRDMFAAQGIAADRLELQGGSPHADFLAAYGRGDIALDTFPYSGGLTTCEALWMGVPVITCPGETFASRHSLTHLSNVGLAEQFVARDLAQYVDLAVRWASDLDRLAEVRASLRGRMAASPLCDGKRFAASLADVLRDAWRKWISGA